MTPSWCRNLGTRNLDPRHALFRKLALPYAGVVAYSAPGDLHHMSDHRKFIVTAKWDDEAHVWVATSDDIPGLATEAKNLDTLLRRIKDVAPELIEDNAHLLERGAARGR